MQCEQIRIAHHILARAPQMNNPACARAPITKRVHMGHHIMAQLPLILGGQLHVLISHLEVRPHLIELLVGDV